MKRTIIPLLLLAASVLLAGVSCTSSSAYSTQLKNEKKLIADYIKRNNIVVIYEQPKPGEWKDNEYLELDDYCYFHLTQMGDTTTDSLDLGDIVELRYRKYTLDVNPDTVSYWTTNEASSPIEFRLGSSNTYACTGWLLALNVMNYSGAEGKLICPSKLGFSEDANSVTPYGYDIKFRIRRF